MGEPFQNKKNVFASIRELMNPETFGMGARHISVSTSGLAKQILEFAEAFPQVNLALSLHTARNEVRDVIMPKINKAYPLEKLSDALTDYIKKTNRKVFIEYILLDGETDTAIDAEALVKFLRDIKPSYLMHVNLIVYNPTDADHKQSTRNHARQFKDKLAQAGIQATIRNNLGRDIDGACGQLAILNQS